jgi:hypothetical protein
MSPRLFQQERDGHVRTRVEAGTHRAAELTESVQSVFDETQNLHGITREQLAAACVFSAIYRITANGHKTVGR